MLRKSGFCRLGSIAAIVLIAGLAAGLTYADTDFEVRGGLYKDAEEPFVGAGLLTSLGSNWFLNPNLEYVFIDDGTSSPPTSTSTMIRGPLPFYWWVGAGPALVHLNSEDGSDTDLGANVFSGIASRRAGVRPFLQGKVIVKDDSEASIAVGLRF